MNTNSGFLEAEHSASASLLHLADALEMQDNEVRRRAMERLSRIGFRFDSWNCPRGRSQAVAGQLRSLAEAIRRRDFASRQLAKGSLFHVYGISYTIRPPESRRHDVG